MRNYFSWKNLSRKLDHAQPHEVCTGAQATSGKVRATLASDDAFTSISMQFPYIQPTEKSEIRSPSGNDFKVRTLEVLAADMTPHNAVLLCCFAIPEMNLNFMAYSLNESLDGSQVRIYIASLTYHNGIYTVEASAPAPGWLSALARIIRESGGDEELISSDTALTDYHLIDLEPHLLTCGVMAHHSTIDISRASVTKLMFWRGKSSGPAIEHCTLDAGYVEPEMKVSVNTSTVSASPVGVQSYACEMPSELNSISTVQSDVVESAPVINSKPLSLAPSSPVSPLAEGMRFSIDQCHELHDDIEKTLGSIDQMTEGFEQHFHASIKQLERQESVQKFLLGKELLLIEQEQRLVRGSAEVNEERQRVEMLNDSLIAREADLKELEVRLATREKELMQGFNQLSVSRTKLSDVVKKLHASMQRRNEQIRDSSGALVRPD